MKARGHRKFSNDSIKSSKKEIKKQRMKKLNLYFMQNMEDSLIRQLIEPIRQVVQNGNNDFGGLLLKTENEPKITRTNQLLKRDEGMIIFLSIDVLHSEMSVFKERTEFLYFLVAILRQIMFL